VPDESADLLHQRVRAELEALDLNTRALTTPALRAAIRGRRRAAGWRAAGAGVLLVAGAAVGVTALLTSGQSTVVIPGGTMIQEPTAATEATPPGCGQLPGIQPARDGLLTAPKEASLDGPGIVELTVTLTNTTGAPLKGTTGHMDVTVVQDNRIVAPPSAKRDIGFAVDLAPKASMTLTGDVALQDCRAGSAIPEVSGKQHVDLPAVSLPAGTYQLYGEVTVFTDSGQPTIFRGGPWPLTLR
jgi:hypothetical protein